MNVILETTELVPAIDAPAIAPVDPIELQPIEGRVSGVEASFAGEEFVQDLDYRDGAAVVDAN